MNLKYHLKRTFPAYLYQRWQDRKFERRTVPETKVTQLEGVTLDIDDLDLHIKREILIKAYEAPEVVICKKIIQPGERILEIGGAIGFVGLFCLTRLKAGSLTSVEPNPVTLKRLHKNYQLNGLTPKVIEAAIADEDKTFQLKTSPEFWTDSILSFNNNHEGNSVAVKALTLASILALSEESFTALIVDVEGAETLIDWNHLPASVNKLILELHPGMVGYPKAYRVLNDILNRGFQVIDRNANVIGLVKNSQ